MQHKSNPILSQTISELLQMKKNKLQSKKSHICVRVIIIFFTNKITIYLYETEKKIKQNESIFFLLLYQYSI